MKVEPERLAALSAVIAHDLAAIKRMDAELQQLSLALADQRHEFRDLAAAAYLLHNIYNALESSFQQISRTFENHVVDRTQWHCELLDKMLLPIPGVRPADSAQPLGESGGALSGNATLTGPATRRARRQPV